MRILDAYTLASTKRRTRRVRTAVVTVISSFLFAILFFGAIVLGGLQQSANSYKNVGLNDRFLSSVQPMSFGDFESANERAIKEVRADLVKRKIAITKEIEEGEEYNQEIQTRAMQFMAEAEKQRQADYEIEVKEKFQPRGVYHFNSVPRLSSADMGQFEAGKDAYLEQQKKSLDSSDKIMSSPHEPMWNADPSSISYMSLEKEMLNAFQRPNQTLEWEPGQPYPVFISYQYLREQLGQTSFKNVSKSEVSDRYKQLIQQYTGKELTFCYRNSAARGELDQVLQYNKLALEDDKAETKPLEIKFCQGFERAELKNVGITNQTTNNAEQLPKPLFPKLAAEIEKPDVRVISFRIAGFVPSMDMNGGSDIVSSIFFFVNNWGAQNPFIIPTHVVEADEWLAEASATTASSGMKEPMFFGPGMQIGQLFVESANRDEQKRFIASGCSGMDCQDGSRPALTPFGSVKVALEDIINFALKGLLVGVAVISLIASIMFMSTISKIIADSVREIAVFRAIGASKYDVAQIYILYGLMIALSSLLTALILAFAAAYALSLHYADEVSQAFVSTLGAYDSNQTATLLGVQPLWLAVVAGALLGSALLGIVLAIVMNMRRNIVKYMREE